MVNVNAQKAREMYRQGKKLVDIASSLGVPAGTVRRWKSEQKWEEEGERSEKETSVRRASKKEEQSFLAREVKRVIENEELTDKQQLFCLYYVRCFNATKAYLKAYGCGYNTAAAAGYKLLEITAVKEEINRLKQAKLNRELLKEEDIFQKYIDIAFADVTDFVEFGREEIQVMGAFGPVFQEDETTGEKRPVMKTVNTVRFREHTEVDGTLITEVKQGKDGASIKLADRMKALEWLAAHMDLATEEQRAKVALLQKQAANGISEDSETGILMMPEPEGGGEDA